MSTPTRGIERHPRSLTDPLFAAYTDATVELRAKPARNRFGGKVGVECRRPLMLSMHLDGVGLSRRAHRALAHSPEGKQRVPRTRLPMARL